MNGKFGIIKRQTLKISEMQQVNFRGGRRFANSDVNDNVHLFNKTIKNLISNYIPHKIIICNDRDHSWVN